MVLVTALALLMQTPLAPPADPDSLRSLRRSAQRLQVDYEGLARRLAPFTLAGERSGGCDEVVGRFCLQYTPRSARRPLLAEPPRVASARRDLIEGFRRLVSLVPGDTAAAGPLVRYLIEDGRAGEALAVARTFAWASEHPVWSALLLGLAHHAAGDHAAALGHFDVALAALPDADREAIESVGVLLERGERRVYDRMDPEERSSYREAVWRLADPLYLTPANERRAEHLARHAWVRLLAMTPHVFDVLPWGRDLEELTIRYGLPVSRERIPTGSLEVRVLERYSPDQLTFVPAALRTRGLDPTPDPGEPWPLDRPAARGAYAPAGLALSDLPHQLNRFPRSDSVDLRLDGVVHLDSATTAAELLAGIIVLEPREYREVLRLEARAPILPGDSALISFQATLPAGDYAYSLEAWEPESGTGARARYPVFLEGRAAGRLAVSDIVVGQAFPDGPLPQSREAPGLTPRAHLVVQGGDTLGVLAEVYGLAPGRDGYARYRVEWSLEPDRGGARLIRWFGRLLGLEGATATRVAWVGDSSDAAVAAIAVNLGTSGLAEGGYTLRLVVHDLVSDARVESLRRVRLAGAP